MTTGERRRNVFLLGLNSDIGRELGRRYLADGHRVYGTYRVRNPQHELENVTVFQCDVTSPDSVRSMVEQCRQAEVRWDLFIGCVGTEEPIGPFLDCDYDEWERSVVVNALGLLRAFHALHVLRCTDKESACAFFTGAGTNNAAVNYSAYSASKFLLIKMCELLTAENPDLNVFIVGPGAVRTKIHEQTLRASVRAGKNYDRVVSFLASEEPGVSFEEIYECLNWCVEAGRAVVGGRNISLVHDGWRGGGSTLKQGLLADPDMYKLRRSGNSAVIRPL